MIRRRYRKAIDEPALPPIGGPEPAPAAPPLYQRPPVEVQSALDAMKAFPTLDPVVQARIRRVRQDPHQLEWDKSIDIPAMLAAAKKEKGVLLPASFFVASARELLRARTGGHLVGNREVYSGFEIAARLLQEGRLEEAASLMSQFRIFLSGLGPAPTMAALAGIIRGAYPSAPKSFGAPLPAQASAAPAPTPPQPRPAQVVCTCGRSGRPLPDSSRPGGWRPPIGWEMDEATGEARCAVCRGTPGAPR